MNSDDLAFFCLVVDAGSIASAAISAGCDASTASRRIASLERAFGARLFVRDGRGLTLSHQGEVLIGYARQVNALISQAKLSINDSKNQGPPSIHIVAQPTIAKMIFGQLFHELRAKFPTSQIHFSEARADKILFDLRNNNADAAVMYRPEHPGSESYDPILFEKLFLIAPPNFAFKPEQLVSKSFAEIPLILKGSNHGSRVFIQEFCSKKLGCQPNVALQNDSSFAVTLELVANNCGCAIMPLAAAQSFITEGRVVAHSLAQWHFERCVALVTGRTDISSSTLWILNSVIRNVVAELVNTEVWLGTKLA